MRVKLQIMPNLNIIGLAKYQQSSEKLLYCGYCRHDWVDIVPDSYPLKYYPCDHCDSVGTVYQGLNRQE